MNNLREKIIKINIDGQVLFDEPMDRHTSFRIGGPADLYIAPRSVEDLKKTVHFASEEDLPLFVFGSGANILVSDRGIRGITVHLKHLAGIELRGEREIQAGAGADVSDIALFAADHGLTGAEFLFSMPGSLGGSVYMNARCYGSSISDIIASVTFLVPESREISVLRPMPGDFSYKRSPFQGGGGIILSASLGLREGEREDIKDRMERYREDREKKGHFSKPSAGSVFKNNHDFGEPSGKLIDRLGLRGFSCGGAMISPEHANIIVNAGGAKASDVRGLIRAVKERVFQAYGFSLEEEVIYAGEWNREDG